MLNQDYKDILSILSAHKVDFMLVGAFAMAYHGYPRATGDIDIFFRPDPHNAKKVWDSLEEFGAPTNQITLQDLQTPGTIFQVGISPRRIDFINRISGVTFDEAYSDRKSVEISGLPVNILSLEKLILNKSSSGRPKDLVDVQTLRSSQ